MMVKQCWENLYNEILYMVMVFFLKKKALPRSKFLPNLLSSYLLENFQGQY